MVNFMEFYMQWNKTKINPNWTIPRKIKSLLRRKKNLLFIKKTPTINFSILSEFSIN